MTEDVKDAAVVEATEPAAVAELSEVEVKATEQGWVAKDKWKGDEDEWVPAKAFLKRGEIEAELKKERSNSSQKEKVIKSMKEYYLNVKDDAKKEVLDTLKKAKRDAIKNQDFEEVARIDLQMDDLQERLETKFTQRDQQVRELEQSNQGPDPAFLEWHKQNSWYVLGENSGLTKEADTIGMAFKQLNPNASYREVLDYTTTTIKKMNPEKFTNARRELPSDVNEPGERTESPSKKYRLTAEEKAAADAFDIPYDEYAKGLKQWDKMKGIA